MRIELVTGGARSGKSRYAQALAATLGGDAVSVIATARALDEDMAQRIARHRAARPAAWELLEAPAAAGRAIVAAGAAVVLLDCLTLLVANALVGPAATGSAAAEAAMIAETGALLEAAAGRGGTLIVVTNEVGSGVHPPTSLGRWFQDGLGRCNQMVAASADHVVLMVSGLPMVVKGHP